MPNRVRYKLSEALLHDSYTGRISKDIESTFTHITAKVKVNVGNPAAVKLSSSVHTLTDAIIHYFLRVQRD